LVHIRSDTFRIPTQTSWFAFWIVKVCKTRGSAIYRLRFIATRRSATSSFMLRFVRLRVV